MPATRGTFRPGFVPVPLLPPPHRSKARATPNHRSYATSRAKSAWEEPASKKELCRSLKWDPGFTEISGVCHL
ncbi:UNVERIFIED_CONTAM: hypothetical protein K2H54_001217 [Gekko kuhli]